MKHEVAYTYVYLRSQETSQPHAVEAKWLLLSCFIAEMLLKINLDFLFQLIFLVLTQSIACAGATPCDNYIHKCSSEFNSQ